VLAWVGAATLQPLSAAIGSWLRSPLPCHRRSPTCWCWRCSVTRGSARPFYWMPPSTEPAITGCTSCAGGAAAETPLAFAGLHQVLFPVLDRAEALSLRHRSALLDAFGIGIGEQTGPPDRMDLSMATLTLLSGLADHGPLLVAIDDVHWFDEASLEVLAFLARRLEGEPIALLLAGRGGHLPAQFDEAFPVLRLQPLGPADAAILLDRQPDPLDAAVRDRVLSEAQGNPLALVELAKVGAHNALPPADGRQIATRLEQAFSAQVAHLPEATRRALLLAAAADTTELAVMHTALPAGEHTLESIWRPAELAGLIALSPGIFEFRHPLVRSAIYHTAPFAERRKAHLALAEALRSEPDRRAAHLAAATTAPDEEVAAIVEAAAERARVRGATAEAIAGFRRAGQLSPDPRAYGRRLGMASIVSFTAGQLDQAAELSRRALELTDDVEVRAWTSQFTGVAASFTMQLEHAFALVDPSIHAMTPDVDGSLNLLVVAAHIAYYSGRRDQRDRVSRALDTYLAALPATGPMTNHHLWILAVSDPFGNAEIVRAALPGALAVLVGDPAERHLVGNLAARTDLTDTAIAVLDMPGNPARDDAHILQGGLIVADLGWACFDAGKWIEAERVVAKLLSTPVGAPKLANTSATTLLATIAAVRGDTDTARRHIDSALAVVEPPRILALVTRARSAAGIAAVADGDHETAYTEFRQLFDPAGDPIHYHLSPYHLADFVAAAIRTGRVNEARTIASRTQALIGDHASPRLRQILARAQALIPDSGDPEVHFRTALTNPAGEQWPYERAQVRLEYGEWLRRNRRITEARSMLAAALNSFDQLGATPWAARARAELRAAGQVARPARSHNALDDLPPRTQQIVRMAAAGLTNREIGDRLYLSHRTVGSHLYRAFPKIGVTSRNQLRDVVDTPSI
jgi:DNA-binding CsgD family transcriptional regulator